MDARSVAQLLHALRAVRIELGERVVVAGESETARRAAQLARVAGALTVRQVAPEALASEPPASADVLLFALDWPRLADALRLVRDRGRVLLITAGGSALDFNLYPDLHRRSLVLAGAPGGEPESPLVDFAQHLIETGQLSTNGPRING